MFVDKPLSKAHKVTVVSLITWHKTDLFLDLVVFETYKALIISRFLYSYDTKNLV